MWISPTTYQAQVVPAPCRLAVVARTKPCADPHDNNSDLPRSIPAGLTAYVLNSYTNHQVVWVLEDCEGKAGEAVHMHFVGSHPGGSTDGINVYTVQDTFMRNRLIRNAA